MKKALIALLVLGSYSFADTQEFNFSGTSTGCVISPDALTATPLTLIYKNTDGVGGNSGDDAEKWLNRADGYVPKIRLDETSNGNKYWIVSTTITNESNTSITLGTLAAEVFACNSEGSNQNYLRTVVVDLAIGNESKIGNELTLASGGSKGGVTFKLDNEITLQKGDHVDISVKVYRPDDKIDGYDSHTYAGLHKISLTYSVPEPTTATLSLLALAGLAARRRRR